MRLNIVTVTLIGFSFLHLCLSRPSLGKKTESSEKLLRRTPYAIVPVDGGGSANGDNDGLLSSTIPPKIPTISVAATQTSIETDTVTLPPLTNYISVTITIKGSTITQLTQITVTTQASPTTITKIDYSTINISPSSQQIPISTAYSTGITSKSTDSFISPSQNWSSRTASPTQLSKSDSSPAQITTAIMSSQNSTQPISTRLTASNPQYTTLNSSNSSSMTYLPYHEPI
ncbi:putative csep0242 effector protein [Erysiphe necator]|uniref:Putative csep0242 effector protein n=1 Tax=Uncinula necator TaxID=52586 RepID=A0A0B1P7K1_UNCNE|nr:putative csep0242 effector protein [Erysiphe necator]